MEIKIKDNNIKLKKDYLTNGEVNYIVTEALRIYKGKDDFEDYNYSPLSMITNFYALLFSLCIDDYNIDSIDDYNKYYNIGAHYELLKNITNADEAYHLMLSLSKDMISLENIIDINLNKVIEKIFEKIPDEKSMKKMIEKLPKEWKDSINNYNSITGINIKEDE